MKSRTSTRKSRSVRFVPVTKRFQKRMSLKVKKVRSRATRMNLRNNPPGFYSKSGKRLLSEPNWKQKSYYRIASDGEVLFNDHKNRRTILVK